MQSKNIPNWLKKLPNRLTYIRILCIPFVVYLMSLGDVAAEGNHFWSSSNIPVPSVTDVIAAAIFGLAAITDFFDGWIARKFHLETMLGKLLDPLADKLLVVSAMIILVEKHRMNGMIAVVLIGRDLGINAIRLSAFNDGIQIGSNWIGKTKTTLQDIGIFCLIICSTLWFIPFQYLGYICIWLAFIASLVSAVQYLSGYAKHLKRS